MKKILVPTDFSENAANALGYALELVKVFKGKLLLFHNAEVPLNYSGTNIFTAGDLTMGMDPAYPTGVLNNPELEKLQQEKINQLVNQVRQDLGTAYPVETFYTYGSLSYNLNEIIQEEQVDLVVMGTQGTSTFLDRLIGTNTASVIKSSPIPVLAIPAEARFTPPKRIAYAADLEQEYDIFLNQLMVFAQPFGAEITLVHIKIENQPDNKTDEIILNDLRSRYPHHRLQLVEQPGKTVTQGLEDFISNFSPDLLAVGIYEHSFFYSVLHQSVPEQLVFKTTIPVLALPNNPLA